MIDTKILEVVNKILRSRRLRTVIRGLHALITRRISLKFAAIMLRRKTSKCNSVEDYVDLAFNIFNVSPFKSWSIRPAQVKEEITELLRFLAKHKPKLILEIGTARGGTLFLFTRASSPDAMIISIDLPGGQFGSGYPEWRKPLYESFAIHKQKTHLIRGDSHAPATLNMVNKILEEHKLDFLFIDGDHTYEGVKMDFETYSVLVRRGGIIAFHDICPHPPQTGCEVNKFWCETKDKYEHIEVVKDWKQGWAGIGVLIV